MPLARCPKCGATFPNTLRECPNCGYSPFARPDAGQQPALPRPAPPRQGPQQPIPPQAVPDEIDPDEESGEGLPLRSIILLAVSAVLVIALIVGGIFFLRSRKKAPPPPEPDPAPVYCADDEHVWAEATCTEPKTCAVCGLTEGEPLGHDFEDNVCTRCGAFEKMFTFSELGCTRRGDTVVFTGAIRNYSGFAAKKIELRLELFDADKNFVAGDTVYILEEEPVDPMDSAQWRFTYDDSAYTWKYWRVSVTNFILG